MGGMRKVLAYIALAIAIWSFIGGVLVFVLGGLIGHLIVVPLFWLPLAFNFAVMHRVLRAVAVSENAAAKQSPTNPMKYRKLRIAWSVAWGVVAVLLCVLWVRSYWWAERFCLAKSHRQSSLRPSGVAVGSFHVNL